MTNFKFIAQEIREVGESVFSNSQDLFLILNLSKDNDVEAVTKIRHGLNLAENILSILTYLSTLDSDILEGQKELMNEIIKIKYSCHELQTTLSKVIENGKPSLHNRKYVEKLLTGIKNSANKIITISYLLEENYYENRVGEVCSNEFDNVCYEDKQTCEQYCPNGFCVEDNPTETNELDNCPEYVESFTESPLIHVENGYEGNELMPWHIAKDDLNVNPAKENKRYCIWDVIKNKFSSPTIPEQVVVDENVNPIEAIKAQDRSTTSDEFVSEQTSAEFATVDETVTGNNENTTDDPESSIIANEYEHEPLCDKSEHESETYTTENADLELDHATTTVDITEEITTSSPYTESYATENYDTTQHNDESSTYSYVEEFTTETPTTTSYETTTQDMYKLSQDIYQAAQDLSSKSSEISSMSSEISSKSSDISSLVSELNNYEDEELSKKIQGVSKLTQEINSKTSEISSMTSTMSSLASDISSASSDMTSADRHHAFRTTPWQKMSSKSDDLITNAQGVVSAAQDILNKIAEVVAASADLKVAASVANMAGQMTAKTQRLISEALSIVSKVIELSSVIDS